MMPVTKYGDSKRREPDARLTRSVLYRATQRQSAPAARPPVYRRRTHAACRIPATNRF